MLPSAKITRRKFYNKWFYKSTLLIRGSAVFRIYSHSQLRELYKEGSVPSKELSYFKKSAWENRDIIIDLVNFLSQFDKSQYFMRIERDAVDLYTNDVDFYDKTNDNFSSILKHRFEPNETSLRELTDEPIIIVKKLPKERYNYRVYLKPHMIKNDKEAKALYLKFLSDQHPAVSISDSVKKWFMTTEWNWDRRYMLVDNEKTLLLLKLRNSDVLGKVYRFSVAINTGCP